jgi:hypothetical protein
LINVYPLKDGFGLLKECGRDENSFISLIFLDRCRGSLQKIQTIEYPIGSIKIVINKADPTTFILSNREFSQICKIVDKTIVIGEMFELSFNPNCFYGKCLYRLEWNYNNQTRVSLLFICIIP